MYAIRQFGTGGHPWPDKQNVSYFTSLYASQCLRRALKEAILDMPERETMAEIVMKLRE